MNENLLNLITKYRRKGILVDTNILMLYFIGSLDIELIRTFKQTASFTENDFEKISKFIDYFEIKVTTPHILTEASNLFGNRVEFNSIITRFIEIWEEVFLGTSIIVKNEAFNKFGLTDTVIAEISKDSYLVLTNDYPLFGYLANKGFDVVSLDQIRML